MEGDFAAPLAPPSMTPKDVYSSAVFKLIDILSQFELRTSSQFQPTVKVPLDEPDESEGHPSSKTRWVKKYNAKYGVCYSLEVGAEDASLGVTQVNVYSFIDVYVFLHHPGQFMDFNSMTKV